MTFPLVQLYWLVWVIIFCLTSPLCGIRAVNQSPGSLQGLMAKHEAGGLWKSHWSPEWSILFTRVNRVCKQYKYLTIYLDLRCSFQKYASCLNICIISSYFERIFYWYARKCSLYLSKVLKVFFSWRGFITRKGARSWELVWFNLHCPGSSLDT